MGTKTLFLLRHAKAITGGIDLPDQDRPLSESGLKDASKLSNKLQKKDAHFDLIVTSPAIRAITTAQIIINHLNMKGSNFLIDPLLYQADSATLLEYISRASKKYDELMIVGHNPSLIDLASHLAGEAVAMPTCALMKVTFGFKDWAKVITEKSTKFTFIN
jgi:phosphohistidine phosphatase